VDYVESYPGPKYFGLDDMYGDQRGQFLEWYERETDKIFRNKEELMTY
jgi:hypothetical protein